MARDRTRRPLGTTLVGHPEASAPAPGSTTRGERPRGERRRLVGPITGPQIRRDIERVAPAFLDPHLHEPDEAFRALVIVLHCYALGSRTARGLLLERRDRDPSWRVPSRREAFDIIMSAAAMRQYLPHVLGNVMAAPAAAPA